MNPYRALGQPGHTSRRRDVIFRARNVREALVKRGLFHNICDDINSSQDIIDALTDCISELELTGDVALRVPF